MIGKTCGDFGGKNKAGDPCRMVPGAGVRGTTTGPCFYHTNMATTPPAPEGEENLSPRELRFIDEYLGRSWFNATKAAREAGVDPKYASQIGYQILNKPRVRTAIRSRCASAKAANEEILYRMTERATASLGPFVTIRDGRCYVDLASDEVQGRMHLIKKIKQRTMEVTFDEESGVRREVLLTEVELHDAAAADRDLAKVQGLFKDETVRVDVHIQQLSDPDLAAKLKEAREKAAEHAKLLDQVVEDTETRRTA